MSERDGELDTNIPWPDFKWEHCGSWLASKL